MSGDLSLTIVDYLKSPAAFVGEDSPSAVSWGSRGVESEIISPLAGQTAAETEATRQAAFLEGPLVEDKVTVAGARRDLMNKTITIEGEFLDYGSGVAAFVIGFQELPSGLTDLFVVRSL